MPNPFWNRDQHRLRALWRLILQLVFFFVLSLVLTMAIAAACTGILIATGQIPTLSVESISAALATPLISALLQFASSAGMILSVWLAGRLLDRRKFSDFGFHFSPTWWIDFSFGLFLGAALMALIFVIELAAGWVTISAVFASTPTAPFLPGILIALFSFIFVGIGEETLFRAYQLRNLSEGLNLPRLNPRAALLIAYFFSSIVFGLFHLGNPNTSVISTINLCIAGLFLGLGFILTGELALPIGLHIAWNFFQGNVFGFPVSGTYAGSTILSLRQAGPEFVTGGAFGPEAGLIGLLAIVIGSLAIFAWVKYRNEEVSLAEEMAIYPPKDIDEEIDVDMPIEPDSI
jgi:uncharacterized protein